MVEPPIRLPKLWPQCVKAGMLHAISLAGVAVTAARSGSGRRLAARLDQAETEIALLREELSIKDGRWKRSQRRRRPHYTPIQRMRILQLQAARGWSREKTARVFLVDALTMQRWNQRLDEPGDRPFVQTIEPVNRYPEFVRGLVRQLKSLFPSMGDRRIADTLARAGLCLAASTVRRITREIDRTPEPEPETSRRRRRVVARHAGHTWHVDLTAVPTRAGFSVPWLPFSLPQRWPFCWWVAVAVDQFSRAIVGVEVFHELPSSVQVQAWLQRTIRAIGRAPSYIVSDKGPQFFCGDFKAWCRRRGIRPRYGAVGEPASIAIVERCIRTLKRECTRLLLVPSTAAEMRLELRLFASWYNEHRPHKAIDGRTPNEAWTGNTANCYRLEPRTRLPPRWRVGTADRFRLGVSYVGGRKHLPVIELDRAA